MKIIIFIGIGGASGSIIRYMIYQLSSRLIGIGYPIQTLIVNFIGCLLMGVLIHIFSTKLPVKEELKAFLTVGFLGGLTTFSAFSADFYDFFYKGNFFEALLYILFSIIVSLFGVLLGVYIMKVFI